MPRRRLISLLAVIFRAVPRSVDVTIRTATGTHIQTIGLPAVRTSRRKAAAGVTDAAAWDIQRTVSPPVHRTGLGCYRPARTAAGLRVCYCRQCYCESQSVKSPTDTFHSSPHRKSFRAAVWRSHC